MDFYSDGTEPRVRLPAYPFGIGLDVVQLTPKICCFSLHVQRIQKQRRQIRLKRVNKRVTTIWNSEQMIAFVISI